MKNIHNTTPVHSGFALPFVLAQANQVPRNSHRKLAGFAKVLAGGRVVGLNRDKPFADRMLADGVADFFKSPSSKETSIQQIILESVATNLEAGVKLLDRQEFALAKMSGRLSEMALYLNQARSGVEQHQSAQEKFEETRSYLRSLAKETFDHTAIFSNGPAKPITVVVPANSRWEGLSIDRSNLKSPGLQAIDAGKVSPSAAGLLLDPETFRKAFDEWRLLCAGNRLQWHLVYQRWQGVVTTLKYFLGGRRWTPPPFPDDSDSGPIRRPHLDN